MKVLKNYRLYVLALSCLLVLGAGAGYAQNFSARAAATVRPQVNIALSGTVERGGRNLSIEQAGRVNSGEVLNWKMVSRNSGDAAAQTFDAVAQIPAGTSFVPGSASSEVSATVSYSVDGGKTFSTRPTISTRQSDGSVKQVPAPVSMYTQIRFHYDAPLAVSGERTASYKVRVN
jgi:uncharacterized repeat protein (TIGR01451 family)